jgi:hypothetical protein
MPIDHTATLKLRDEKNLLFFRLKGELGVKIATINRQEFFFVILFYPIKRKTVLT